MDIEEILKKHINEEGKFDQIAAAKELKETQGKEFVPKSEFNSKNEELKSANATLETLKKENKDVEALQTKVQEHETKAKELQEALVNERKTFAVKEALTKEGVSDVDYMLYKLGELEVDKDGNVKELDSKVKELKEANPSFFKAEKDNEQDNNPPGYQVIDNGLDTGKQTDPIEAATADFEAALGITNN
ncbi:Phage minor structural protein GP20 [Alkalibacterium subtropicum]|uniref:Phage minor structural protein GP20 n=1 Tax=Alkalibacterium subtropicum TaxID=753702 RepID=A0A1I1EVA0_9LACT|nr:phage scaffolding protein [Alkalibacterium subtropicum]SFB90612.1 Phage minor structural protein GP20 [Alkalibacterium subtropicum]